MRVLIAQRQTFIARRMLDEFENHGLAVIGPARSSGEAWLLAQQEQPSIVVVGVDLESAEAGARLADKIDSELSIPCILVTPRQRVDPATIVQVVRSDGRADEMTDS